MIGFRSSRSARDAAVSAARGVGDGMGTERTDRDRRFGRRLVELLGEVGAAIEEQPWDRAERR
jgi:hypothetical protein